MLSNVSLYKLRDLKDWQDIKEGSFKRHTKKFDFQQTLFKLDDILNKLSENKGFKFSFKEYQFSDPRMDSFLPQELEGDEDRFIQIALNVITNAINNTQHGYVKVQIKYLQQKSIIKMTCKDTGCGIKRQLVPKIFTLFPQNNQRKDGVGLGLYISKQLVSYYDGKISFKTQYGKGSNFQFSFQMQRSGQEDWQETSRFLKKNENNVSFMDEDPQDMASDQDEIDDFSNDSNIGGFSNIIGSSPTK